MTDEQIKVYEDALVRVTLRDGSQRTGRLDVTPEDGLYHLTPDPSRPGVIERFGPLEDLYTEDFAKIERL
jgi:hypothetical protein